MSDCAVSTLPGNGHPVRCSAICQHITYTDDDDVMTWKRFPHYWLFVQSWWSPVGFPAHRASNAELCFL